MLTEQDYPIQKYWLLKPFAVAFFYLLAFYALNNISHGVNFGQSMMSLKITYFIIGVAALFLFCLPAFTVFTLKFSLEEDYLQLQQGLLSSKRGNVFYSKIQDISIQQGIIDRFLGLYTVYIQTAAAAARVRSSIYTTFLVGLSDGRVSVPGLMEKQALALKEELLTRASKARSSL
ncbi:MAG: Bacterial domain [Gammaproteobacteria bacterium]|jgi:uncharacterized membrane protein YdbT with pleckstrin-like domain|nr:Bacterial domain [Gammaproteobacteria bacterium]